jgi:hypothetical protein
VVDGGLDDTVIIMWEVVAEATSTVEGGVQGPDIDCFSDASEGSDGLGVEVCNVTLAKVVVSFTLVLAYGRLEDFTAGEFLFVMVLPEPDAHGALGLAYVASVAWGVGGTGTWGLIDNS